MAKIIHLMIRVSDERRSVDFYEKAFGLRMAHRMDFDAFSLVYLRNDENDMEIELTINNDRQEAYSHGDGYGHVAVCVDDVKAEHERFTELGFEPRKIVEFKNKGEHVASFFFVADPDGYEIEVLQRLGRYR